MTIKPDKSRVLLFLGLIFIFMCTGAALMALPPRDNSIIPFNRVLQPMVGLVGCLFGLAGLGALLWRLRRPIAALDAQGIHYFRQELFVPWSDIKRAEVVQKWGGQKVRWIYLFVTDPGKYAAYEKENKRWGLVEADVLLDFNLASAADFQQTAVWLQAQLDERRGG